MKTKAPFAPADFRCANGGCPVIMTGRDKVNQRCGRCRAVFYYGRRCQKQLWDARGGNHRGRCKPAPAPAPEAAAFAEGFGDGCSATATCR